MSRADDLHSITPFHMEGPTTVQCNEPYRSFEP